MSAENPHKEDVSRKKDTPQRRQRGEIRDSSITQIKEKRRYERKHTVDQAALVRRVLNREPFASVASKNVLGAVYEKSHVPEEPLPKDATPASLRPIVEKLIPGRGKRFDALGGQITKLASYLDKEGEGNPHAIALAAELIQYGRRLAPLEQADSESSDLTPEKRKEFDSFCGVTRYLKLKHPELNPDDPTYPEVLTETRREVLQQFFSVVEHAAEGSELHQRAVEKTYARYLGTFAEKPEQELLGAIIDHGFKQVQEAFSIGSMKISLDLARKMDNTTNLADLQRDFAKVIGSSIQKQFPYDSDAATSDDILKNKKANCIGATLVGGKALEALEIPYAVVHHVGHTSTIMATEDGKVYWQDFLSPSPVIFKEENFSGEMPDGTPLSQEGLAQWIKNPTKEGLVINYTWKGKQRYVVLSGPEQGHKASFFDALSEIMSNQDKHDEILIVMKHQLELNPKSPITYHNRAVQLGREHEDHAALAVIDQGIALGIPEERLFLLKADILSDLNRPEEALPNAEKVVALNPNDASGWEGLANIHSALGHYGDAAQAYEKTLQHTSEAEDAYPAAFYAKYAYALNMLDRHEEALIQETKAVALEPDDASYWHNRAVTYEELGNIEAAIDDYTQAIELEPENLSSWENLVNLYYTLEQWENAAGAYEKIIALTPEEEQSAIVHDAYGYTLGQLGNQEAALAQRTQAIALDPDNALYWNNRGVNYERLGDMAAALQDFTEARDRDLTNELSYES